MKTHFVTRALRETVSIKQDCSVIIIILLIIFCLGLERSDSVRMRPGSWVDDGTPKPPRVQAWEEWQKIERKKTVSLNTLKNGKKEMKARK